MPYCLHTEENQTISGWNNEEIYWFPEMKFWNWEGFRMALIQWIQLRFSIIPLSLPFSVCQHHPRVVVNQLLHFGTSHSHPTMFRRHWKKICLWKLPRDSLRLLKVSHRFFSLGSYLLLTIKWLKNSLSPKLISVLRYW